MRSRGDPCRGEAHHNAKLTDRDVRWIRKAYAAGLGSQSDLARRFGIGQMNVSRIVRRVTWKHV